MGTLFEVSHLSIGFPEHGKMNKVVDDLSFLVNDGEILGVVGESGSGKSMTALAAMGLLSKEASVLSGKMTFDGKELLKLSRDERSAIAGNDMSMIFQEPMTSLNPVMKIGQQVGESLRLHRKMDKAMIHKEVVKALADVGLKAPEALCKKYPHELSGGMRQRVMIAQAMICSPKLLIADEPTTALDVIVQEQILGLLKKLHEKRGVSILFISHDLNVIKQICQKVIVMYKGVIVEQGTVDEVLNHPKHEYTKTLVASMPGVLPPLKDKKPVLTMEHLNVFYKEKASAFFKNKERAQVIWDLNLTVYDGEILGIVGESGCGKSTLAKTVVGLNRDFTGTLSMEENLRPQMVFQDPFSSLNPARKIGFILSEPLRLRGIRDKALRRKMAEEMLEQIGLDKSYYGRYAHELSGGQRQRISIGTALLMDSKLLVADEPVSALDVTVQSQILKLLLDIHKKKNLTILFISHDLNIVRHICHRVAVIYLGEIVEMADVREIYENPCHPYTKRLFAAALSGKESSVLKMAEDNGQDSDPESDRLKGTGPDTGGCAFAPRCPARGSQCLKEKPDYVNICKVSGKEHWVRCFNE